MSLSPGVHSVLVTPFAADESVDVRSLRTLVDYCLGSGVAGVLVLGVLGEADRLSDRERERVQAVAIEHAAGRAQVTVGVTHASTFAAAERARSAERAGATAVMAAPPIGTVAGRTLQEHFRRIADRLSIPVVVQDLPLVSGVRMPVMVPSEPASSSCRRATPPRPPKT